MIPGQNLLNMALRIIAKQEFIFFAYLGRENLPNGLDAPTYAAGVKVFGSAQPTPKQLIEQMGLDLQKTYFTFYFPQDVVDVDRDTSGDQFVLNGKTYQVLSITPWLDIDGWNQAVAVKVPGKQGIDAG